MSRSLAVIICSLALYPASASAQLGQGPPTPLVVDLGKVAVGSYADYTMTMGTMPPMTMKMALVGKSSASHTLEMSVEGGMMAAAGGKVITQITMTADADKDNAGRVQKVVMQMGAGDPMEMPAGGAQQRQFAKPDPKTFVANETIKVAAGSYKTKHYRDKTPQGDPVDVWVSESVPPVGLVKMETTQSGNPMVKGPIKIELAATGKGAKPTITKPAKPFDQAALIRQMTGGHAPPPTP